MRLIEATNLHYRELVGALLEGKSVKEALAGLDRLTLRHSSTQTSMISGNPLRDQTSCGLPTAIIWSLLSVGHPANLRDEARCRSIDR